MKKRKLRLLRVVMPLLMLGFITLCRFRPDVAEAYARGVYPWLSAVLSAVSSVVPFSLEEVLAVCVVGWMLVFPMVGRRRHRSWMSILRREAECLVWIYIWFYWGWGLNYFRPSFYVRAQVPPVEYDEQAFLRFLSTYADSLNAAYVADPQPDLERMDAAMKAFFRSVPASVGLARPHGFQVPKRFTFTPLYSGVGVLGSMGPFFGEAQLNADLLPLQLPFTYVHEFSHLLGVSNEAEANYWAYRACVVSPQPAVRYSGYFGILSYVLSNASALLPEERFRAWVQTVRPEVLADYRQKQVYWSERYSPWLGEVQDWLYDGFLKSNRIASGRRNYGEVVGLLLAEEARTQECRPEPSGR